MKRTCSNVKAKTLWTRSSGNEVKEWKEPKDEFTHMSEVVLPSHQRWITFQPPLITPYCYKYTRREECLRVDLHAAFHNLASSCGQLAPRFSTAGGATDDCSQCHGVTHDRGQKTLSTSTHSERQLRGPRQRALVMWAATVKKYRSYAN